MPGQEKIYGHVIANEFDLTHHACFVFCFSAQTRYFMEEIDDLYWQIHVSLSDENYSSRSKQLDNDNLKSYDLGPTFWHALLLSVFIRGGRKVMQKSALTITLEAH